MIASARLFATSLLIGLAACATPSPAEPDPAEVARAILTEQAEAARAAAEVVANAPQPEPVPVPEIPIWKPTELGLQHITSGYICPAEAAGFKRIGQDVFPGLGPGHDVACVY